jgi:3-deoxy-D-manno-octulosonic-acid transferase
MRVTPLALRETCAHALEYAVRRLVAGERRGRTHHRSAGVGGKLRSRMHALAFAQRNGTCARPHGSGGCRRRRSTNWRQALPGPGRLIYTALLALVTPLALARLAWRARRQPGYLQHVGERFGSYPAAPPGAPIWLHAVSVGETRAAEPLVAALRAAYPAHPILLTHTTPTGRRMSEELFGDSVARCYLPYDLPFAVRRFVQRYRPHAGLLMETELWPNLVGHCESAGIPLLLVNARMSQRSARGYARLASLTAQTLRSLAGIGAQTESDAKRLRDLGAREVAVTGNLKFDRVVRDADLQAGKALRALFGARPVLLAASTRDGEEALVLEAVRDAPPALLTVIVPRHPQRFDDVARMLERLGLPYQRRSAGLPVKPQTQVLLGDSMGEMYAYYAACDVAFIGGSLLPLGGQNLLEACAVGRPVLIGPHTFNFAEATEAAIAAGAAVRVADAAALSQALRTLLDDPARRERMGQAGRDFMRQHQGATRRTLELLARAGIRPSV